MRKIHPYLFRLLICTSFVVVGLSPHVSSAATCKDSIAKAVSVQGTVVVQRTGESQWQPVKLNDTFCPGDTIQVKRRSRAEIAQAKSTLRLNANTTITLKGVKKEETSLIDLTVGAAYFFSHAPRSLEVVTPSANAAVRGTEFFIKVEEGKTSLTIFEGEVLASNQAGTLTLARGQSAVVEAGQAPVVRTVVRPRDAVQWTLYYPPVLDVRAGDFPGADAFRKGDLQQAFDSLEGAAGNDPRLLTYLASLELSVGNVDAARTDIDQALGINSKYSDAFALKAIIAVAQNDKEGAFSNAQKAVQADPKSATAQIALSYAQQARFDLDDALTSNQIAVQLDSKNALAWARLAELQSAHGNRDGALESAQQAASLSPNLSRTQTVLGFAHLAREDTDEARAAFQKAIQSDQGDPLPKLGLGLAKIRDNQLAEGRGDIEAAVGLDPGNSLMRSYLGKAYYEEHRGDRAEGQFEVAQAKDPNDPTPLFYDAIEKQTTNRPVEALRELNKAIELNDNRAIYRSRLLLDSDLAARSAAVGRIYTDLGFQQRALLEGWKSVNTDNTSFAAHRFLADTYAALPRHEIARVSELLQSQMLQPLNMTPIQPRLGESNLFLISSSGPGASSFNEFNPLFKKDGVTFQTTGMIADNNGFLGEGIVSGIFDKVSFSAGYSFFSTDGFREGAFQKDKIGNVFVQYELTPQTSVQAEYRNRSNKFGDLALRFFEDDFFPTQENSERTETIRVGARHNFTPNNIVLVSFMYQENDTQLTDSNFIDPGSPAPPPFQLFVDLLIPKQRARSVEGQHLFRSKYVNLTSGAGYFDVDGQIDANIGFFIPPLPVPCCPIPVAVFTTPIVTRHLNLYSYAQIKPLDKVTVTAGVSWDYVQGDFPGGVGNSHNQVNPKVGLLVEPFKGTTLRAAVFKTLRRTLITQQTLEPTQVAGFNQFFDDNNLMEAWRYGGGIDQVITKDIYGGVEFSQRDLKQPFQVAGVPTEADWIERLWRAYLFWTPHKWVALRAQYLFESLDRRDTPLDLGALDSKTHRVPLGISVFHPSGFSASFTNTYFNQKGQYGGALGGVFAVDPILPGSDKFWVADLAVNYRLPKRTGFISLGVSNLFDEEFNFFDSDFNNPSIQPERTAFVRVTLQLQ